MNDEIIAYLPGGIELRTAGYEQRAIVHDPSTGKFTSSGSGGITARNKHMVSHALTHAHPENALKDMVHLHADKNSKVGKADASGKSPVHVDGEHVGHISSVTHSGGYAHAPGVKYAHGKLGDSTTHTAHHLDGSASRHSSKKDALRALTEKHFEHITKEVEHAAAHKHAETAAKRAEKDSAEAHADKQTPWLSHANAATSHRYAAHHYTKAGNHEKAAHHNAIAAHHDKLAAEN